MKENNPWPAIVKVLADKNEKEENRVANLFKECGKNFSYSRPEINVLRSLGLMPNVERK